MFMMAKIAPAIANFVNCFGIVLYGVYGLNCLGRTSEWNERVNAFLTTDLHGFFGRGMFK